MNIVYLTTEDLSGPSMSGKVHFWAMARELQRRGHSVSVLAPRYAGPVTSPDPQLNVLAIATPGKHALGLLCFECALWWQARRIVRQTQADVLLVRGGGPGWIPGLVFLRFRGLGVRVVLECNGVVWEEYRLRHKPWPLVWNVIASAWQQAKTCHHILGVTPEIAAAYGRLGGRGPAHQSAVSNGVYPDEFGGSEAERQQVREARGIPRESLVAGYVGAFSPWHNLERILDAAELLQQRGNTDVIFLLVGEGELWQPVKAMVNSRRLDHVRLPGPARSGPELRQWLQCFDVGLCTNIPLHGSPLKLFEYLAAGLPILGSGFPQVTYICHHESAGIALEQPTGEAIADALLQVQSNRHHWQQVGQRNRQLAVTRYAWPILAGQVEEALARRSMNT